MEHEELIQATCPECRGPLRRIRLNHVHEYECLVGHKYSAQVLLRSHSETEERALWSAVVALEEAREMVAAVSSDFPPDVARRLASEAEIKYKQAATIRALLEKLEPFQV